MKKRIALFLIVCIMTLGILPNHVNAESKENYSVDMYIGDSILLPESEVNENIKWKSNNNKIAVVFKNEKVIAKNKGKVKIIGTDANGEGEQYVLIVIVKEHFFTICSSADYFVSMNLWNEGFCDIYNYIAFGVDYYGYKIDEDTVHEAIENIRDALVQVKAYDSYFKNLPKSKHNKLEKCWTNVRNETYKLYNQLKRKKPKALDKSNKFSVDKFEQYMEDFGEAVYSYL